MLRLRVADSNPRTDDDLRCLCAFAHLEPAAPIQGVTAEGGVDAQRLSDLPRTGEKHRSFFAAAPATNHTMPSDRFARTNQHRCPLAIPIGHEIQHLVHPVTQIDIRAPRRTPHRGIAGGEPSTAVVRAVVGVAVSLYLGDPEANLTVPDFLAQ
jgi:hypothetical protein